jgi:hypothetical protein
MKKVAVAKELLEIANELDNLSLFSEANTITKIANIVVAEDMKHDPMVFNPDDQASDDLDAMSGEFDQLLDMLMDAKKSGDLNEEDMHSIMNILQQETGRQSQEMSFEDDEYDDEEDDEDPNAWQYEDDESDLDDEEHEQRGRGGMEYPDLDDDF